MIYLVKNMELVVVLDNIRSALNVGAIFRTCDGANVKKIYSIGITPSFIHPKVKKTALGAENYIENICIKDTQEAINLLKSEGYKIVSIEQDKRSMKLGEENIDGKIALVFGNEITGVSNLFLKESDFVLELPMLGKKNSLNVATTAGIIIYYLSILKK